MKFTKLQSAGNDFVLIENDYKKQDWAKLAVAVCDRHFGVGADGLLLFLPAENADVGMRIFNTDGSEAEACGNGLRCLVKYVAERGLVDSDKAEITIDTVAGIRQARITQQNGVVGNIQVGMGKPEFEAAKIPVAVEVGKGRVVDIISDYPLEVIGRELSLSFIAMGNPHAIYFQQQPVAEFPLANIGHLVEKHKLFPRRVNFEVARVVNRQSIEVRVWERGVGETLACGSGACAVAVSAQLLGYADNPVCIRLPGGTLEVEWSGAGEVLLSGPAEIVFDGELPD